MECTSYVPVHGIVHLAKYQEDITYDLLPNLLHLLKDIGLKGGGTCPLATPKAVEHILELYGYPQVEVEDDGH